MVTEKQLPELQILRAKNFANGVTFNILKNLAWEMHQDPENHQLVITNTLITMMLCGTNGQEILIEFLSKIKGDAPNYANEVFAKYSKCSDEIDNAYLEALETETSDAHKNPD